MNPAERVSPQPIESHAEAQSVAARLNPVYTSPGYNRFPQPAPERYFILDTASNFDLQAVNGEQIFKDYGPAVGGVVRSALNVYNEIEEIKNYLSQNTIKPEEEAIYRGELNAKNAYFQGLCTIVGDHIDVRNLINAVQQANILTLEEMYE